MKMHIAFYICLCVVFVIVVSTTIILNLNLIVFVYNLQSLSNLKKNALNSK